MFPNAWTVTQHQSIHKKGVLSARAVVIRTLPQLQPVHNQLQDKTVRGRQVSTKVSKPDSGAGYDPNSSSTSSSAGGSQPPQPAPEPSSSSSPAVAEASELTSSGPGSAAEPPSEAPPATEAAYPSPGSPLPDAPASSGAGGGGGLGGGLSQSNSAGAAAVGGGGGGGGGGGPSAVTLLTRFNGVGYTFVLAGFLKIVTVGGLAMSAPTDLARTAFGKASPYLMVPVGLAMCWAAKQVVDSGLNESKRFMQYLVGVLVLLYFGLTKLMYRYAPDGELVRRPRPRMPGPMAELRAELGDRELLAGGVDLADSRAYQPERPGSKELYDDVAWYEGRYPSQLGAPRPGASRSRAISARAAAAAATDTDDDYAGVSNWDMLQSRSEAAEPAVTVKSSSRRSYLSDSSR